MLYCPKCSSTYEEGTQRFCTHDGMRLLPSTESAKGRAKSTGVFSNILERTSPTLSGERGSEADLSASRGGNREPDLEALKSQFAGTTPHSETSYAKTRNEELRKDFPLIGNVPPKPSSRLIRPHDIPSGHADLQERQTGPDVSSTYDPDKPDAFVGKIVKGRYHITERLQVTPTSTAFLAEDLIVKGRKVTVRIMSDEKRDDQITKILAEERVSLSHVNHPNIASLIDSGELTGGRPFIISEFVQGKTIKEFFLEGTHFNAPRVARIVRQVASALGEAHENAILHRSLKPESIVLSVSDAGTELVKVKEFAVYRGTERFPDEDNFYLSPEQLEGGFSTFASDIYALATIAYQMLTARLPFVGRNRAELLKAQKEGLSLRPSNLRLELPSAVDEILERALSPNPLGRYPKARDFGEALFNALAKNSAAEASAVIPEATKKENVKPGAVLTDALPRPAKTPNRVASTSVKTERSAAETAKVAKAAKASPAEGSSSGSVFSSFRGKSFTEVSALGGNLWRYILLGIGAAVALAVVYGILTSWSSLFPESPTPSVANQTRATNANIVVANVNTTIPSQSSNTAGAAPKSVTTSVPSGMVRFENSKSDLSGDLAKNFRGFSVLYPSSWTKSRSTTNFLDIKRATENGIPIEQMLVRHYQSGGKFDSDRKNFSALVKKSNESLSKEFDSYRFLGEGEYTTKSAWKALEMKFEAEGTTRGGETIKIFGRRFFFPGMRSENKIGLVVTLIATSLSPDVKGAGDVAVKGELSSVFESFEPAPIAGLF